jgi:cytochrome c553
MRTAEPFCTGDNQKDEEAGEQSQHDDTRRLRARKALVCVACHAPSDERVSSARSVDA